MDVIEQIRKGEIDCNNKDLFFKILLKGLISELNKEIKIRNTQVPHIILSLGDEIMYLENKGYDHSKEPTQNTNENYIYNIIPRCNIEPGGITLQPDQLSSPYCRGMFEFQYQDNIYNLSAEFRRMPLTMTIDLKYYTDSYTDMLELTQQIITNLSFIRTFNIVYMGQQIKCSYNIPDSLDNEYTMDFDGLSQDDRSKTLNLSLDISTNLPIFDSKTVVSTGCVITNLSKNPINGADIKTGYNIKVLNTNTIK